MTNLVEFRVQLAWALVAFFLWISGQTWQMLPYKDRAAAEHVASVMLHGGRV